MPAGAGTRAVAATARGKQELTALFAGRPAPQPRDESGRFARRSSGFDGGVRGPLPAAESPERAARRLLGHLIGASRTFRARL